MKGKGFVSARPVIFNTSNSVTGEVNLCKEMAKSLNSSGRVM